MTLAVQSLYQFKKADKIIFVLFLISFPLLMSFSDTEDAARLKDYFIWVSITLNAIFLVYLTVFKWIKRFNSANHYFFLLIKILVSASILVAVQTFIFNYFFEHEIDAQKESYLSDVLSILVVLLLLSSVLLGIIMLKKGIEAQIQVLKNESLQKSNELRILKSQIDPHFLFNNLNTLDALIDTEPQKAKPYIQRLAKLYQYLLMTKDEDTVNLQEEMSFAKDYIYLIKERFGDIYQFKIIDDRKNRDVKLVPPGAIQTVFENIVKHNNASKRNPIITKINIEEKQIIISNNIRSRKESIASFGIGLKNLQSRYKILCNKPITVEVNGNYTISLPLIQKLIG